MRQNRWNRALIVLVVVAIHTLVLSLLWQALHQALPNRPSSKVAHSDRSPTIVFLLEPYAPVAIKVRLDKPQLDARPTRANRIHDTAVPGPAYGSEASNAAALVSASAPVDAASASLVPPTTGDATAMPSAGTASAEVPKQSGRTLNLALSREALKSLSALGLAARTPFQSRLPATVERKIAEAAAATGPWTEERIDSDHIRMRRGTTCIIYSRPQIAKIDPFSDSISRMPWGANVSECR